MPGVLEDRPGHVVRLEGVLDVPAAANVRDAVLQFDAGDRVVIECHHVRELQDSALASLAWSLVSRGRRVEFRGLSEHHVRVLRYLGVNETVRGGDNVYIP
jgi:hypothetical protein